MLGRLLRGLTSLFKRGGGGGIDERRDLIRLPLAIPVFCKMGTKNLKATLVDVSVGGLRLSVPGTREFVLGEHMTVGSESFDDADAVACKVMWTQSVQRAWMIGLKFTDPPTRMRRTWVKRCLRESGLSGALFRERRNVRRVKVRMPIEVTTGELASAENPTEAPLLISVTTNISDGGVAFRSTMRLPVGSLVKVTLGPLDTLPRISVSGRILSTQEEFGDTALTYRVSFLDPMPEGFVRFLKKQVG